MNYPAIAVVRMDSTRSETATATANVNIALIKYWGKADESLIIPNTSSLSLTLDGLATTTRVEFLSNAEEREHGVVAADPGSGCTDMPGDMFRDMLSINGVEQQGRSLQRVSRFLDIVRLMAGISSPARVVSNNTVPYAAGLASSSSAFAALAGAAAAAAGLGLTPRELSRLARRGSGSACRSIFGGLVQWHAGNDDESSYAEQVDPNPGLAVIVILISDQQKALSSREAMRRTVTTSPLYAAWVESSHDDLHEALQAVEHHDLEKLGAVCEANALGMHATMMASRPAVTYWLPATLAAYRTVVDMRAAGFHAWATVDAGANVKVLTSTGDASSVAAELRERLGGVAVAVHSVGSGMIVTRGWMDTGGSYGCVQDDDGSRDR